MATSTVLALFKDKRDADAAIRALQSAHFDSARLGVVPPVHGEVGAVRSVANEVLVGKTQYSYTYTQTVRAGRPYNLYHGTLEVRPVTDKTSKIVYTLMYDNSMLPDDAAREKDKASRTAVFTRAMQNMKTLAEGGSLAPRPQH